MANINLFPELQAKIGELEKNEISDSRRKVLQPLVDYIQKKKDSGEPVLLNFICTHNSRRSQLAQVWAQVISAAFNIKTECFSGGTEETAFHQNAIDSLQRAGFKIENFQDKNPVVKLHFSDQSEPMQCYSKVYDNKENPSRAFAAVMTCAHADENCPFIPGAEARIPLDYMDPKEFDNSTIVKEKYDERRDQIGAEMIYVFKNIK
jgi:arsenate reductase (thioredoxin)